MRRGRRWPRSRRQGADDVCLHGARPTPWGLLDGGRCDTGWIPWCMAHASFSLVRSGSPKIVEGQASSWACPLPGVAQQLRLPTRTGCPARAGATDCFADARIPKRWRDRRGSPSDGPYPASLASTVLGNRRAKARGPIIPLSDEARTGDSPLHSPGVMAVTQRCSSVSHEGSIASKRSSIRVDDQAANGCERAGELRSGALSRQHPFLTKRRERHPPTRNLP